MNQYFLSPTLWLDTLVKASLLLMLVWAGAQLMRKCNAAVVHRWWALGMLGCLLTPFVSFVTPTWTLSILPNVTSVDQPTAVETLSDSETGELSDGQLISGHHRVDVRSEQEIRQNSHQSRHPAPMTSSSTLPEHQPPELGNSIAAAVPPSVPASMPVEVGAATPDYADFRWGKIFILLWAMGVVVCWGKMACQHFLLYRMVNRCVPVRDEGWNKLLGECSRVLGIRATVRLLERAAADSPVSAGVWSPVVLVPADAMNWSRDRIRLVLLHELGHVARRDVMSQTIGGLACGLYWFNPLYWWGLSQMRKLRELACDDLVLSSGQRATGYADTLLEIARTYRHRCSLTAVGMAHSSNVESRIMAILDETRRHATLSRAAARALLVSSVLLMCSIATANLQNQADPPVAATEGGNESDKQSSDRPVREAKSAASNEDSETALKANNDSNLRAMRIVIVDDDGKPLAGAKLTVGVSYTEDYDGYRTPKEHTADADGTIRLTLPERLRILRLWPQQPGYVGEFKNFGKGTHREGELIPDEFEFRLSKGHPIGGRITDTDGNPIEGVHVRVRVDDTAPMVSTWLTDSFNQPTVKTDEQGRWQLANAPAPKAEGADCSFRLKLTHDDYVSDKHWGASQQAQGVNAAQLRSGKAEIVLHRGTMITGVVTDVDGNPVTKGWVVWNDEPYFNDGVFEAEIQPDGGFSTPPLPSGEYPISIIAPGFAAQRRVVDLQQDLSSQHFQLRPGRRVEIRIVDSSGNSVPNASFYLANSSDPNTWQGSNALHNHKHPNVPDYGIPRRANDAGVFIWEWAPEEPVTYGVGAKGFAYQEVSLVAKSDPHTVTLPDARVATGRVTDVTTGKPIDVFQAMPVIVYRPDFFSTRLSDAREGTDGHYELPLTGGGDPNYRYRVRFEAEGYRSVVSDKSFGPKEGRVKLDFRLEPAPMRRGRVVDADGNPVANAQVIEGTPTWVPSLSNGQPRSYGERIIETDSDGRFILHATEEPVRVRVLHETGIAEKLVRAEEDSIGEMQLRPWAKVSGRLLQDGKPVANQTIYINSLIRRGLGEARFQDSYYAQTAQDGSFAFDRLPPGGVRVRAGLGPWQDSPLTSAESLALNLRPGETREVVLGGPGAVITGQVVATGRESVPLNRKWSLNFLVSRDRGVRPPAGFPELSFDPSSPMETAWSLDPRFDDWVATRENHFVKLTPDGSLRVTGVAPGDYDLLIRLYEQPAGCLVETVGEKVVPVHIDGESEVELGEIEVPCRAGPRPGSDMRAFEFVDNTGKKSSVAEMAGHTVVMHVWASWCAPCMHSMPDIEHTVKQFARTVTLVGLNVDEDSGHAKELVSQKGWGWSQNYLGSDSDLARQLAISSVPTYYLIGPDGMLIASANEWIEIKKHFATDNTESVSAP